MKPTLSSFFNRFQIRLLLFLLLVGSIPLMVAAFVFNAQFTAIADQEEFELVEKSHILLLERTRQELETISRDLKQITDDYAVQRYVSRRTLQLEPAEEQRLREYIDMLMKRQTSQNKYVLQLCISTLVANQTICSQSDSVQIPINMMNREIGKGFIPLAQESASDVPSDNTSQSLFTSEPILDIRTRAELGYVQILIPIDQILMDLADKTFESRGSFTIKDQEGRIVFLNGTRMEPEEKKGWVHSETKLSLPVGEWESTMDVAVAANASLMNMRDVWIGLFILLAVVSVFSSILFARHVTKPLHNLRAHMKRAELGDLKAYWMVEGIDELNDLGQSYNQMLNRLEELIKQVKLEESLKKEAELEALQYQLNPHFLYNTLNTIKWVAKIHKTPQISDVVSALVRLLQASLGKKGDFITIREEVALIKDYMEIQSFRYGERVRITFELDELAVGCLVPRMILQPLVENAILHGIEPTKKEGVITIRAFLDRDLLICEVEDNGVGIASKAAGEYVPEAMAMPMQRNSLVRERLSGVGLMHIREKIKLYYGPDYKMLVINKPGKGTTVRMFLPIHQIEEEMA